MKRSIEELNIITKTVKDKVVTAKSELIRAHVERSKNRQVFFRNLMDSIEGSINDINNQEIQTDDDMDLMIIAHED